MQSLLSIITGCGEKANGKYILELKEMSEN